MVIRSVIFGSLSFAAVSLAGFGVWAFAGRWFYKNKNLGEVGLYIASTIVFLGLSGLLMHRLVRGNHSVFRFYKAFIPAFLAYAVVWSLLWFWLKFGLGEWLGSLLGCAVFAILLRRSLGSKEPVWKAVLLLFIAHSAGYFLGSMAFSAGRNPPQFLSGLSKAQLSLLVKLLWGLFYGLGFGAGIGYCFHAFQKSSVSEN